VGSTLTHLVDVGALDLPLPGDGATAERFDGLSEVGAVDLSLARLVEGHVDALAILAEAGRSPADGAWGVWAADPPAHRVTARRASGGWTLEGTKRYCSGSTALAHALVTAIDEDEQVRLFHVELDGAGIEPVKGTWPAVGMAGSDSLDTVFHAVFVPDPYVVGGPHWYRRRAGFWHGSVGVAACWFGGALGAARLLAGLAASSSDEHRLAHLGAAVARCAGMRAALHQAAAAIDADPLDVDGRGRSRALTVRHLVETGGADVLERVGRGSGSAPMVFDEAHARRVADLPVYLRQTHAERDLAELGRTVVESGRWP